MKQTFVSGGQNDLVSNPLIRNARPTWPHQLNGGVCLDERPMHFIGVRQNNIPYRYMSYTGNVQYNSYDTGGNLSGIALSPDGTFVLSTGASSTLIKINIATGNVVWTRSTIIQPNNIFIDSLGYIYAIGNRVSNTTTQVFNPDGTILFSMDHGANGHKIVLDNFGNIYTIGNRTGPATTLRKYNQSGTLLWSADHGADPRGLAIDKDGNVYQGGVVTSLLTTRKYTPNGILLWSVNHGQTVRHIEVDNELNVYTGGDITTAGINGQTVSGITKRKYDKDGKLLWSVIDSQETYWFKLLNDGTIIYAGQTPSTGPVANTTIHRRSALTGQLINGYSFNHANYLTWGAL